MGENRVAQNRVRQLAYHCRLNDGHHFACFSTKRGESQDAIAFGVDEHFYKTAGFAKSHGPQYRGHWHLRQPIGEASPLRLRFVQTDSREFRIGEHAEGYEPIACSAAAAAQVIADDAEIVE